MLNFLILDVKLGDCWASNAKFVQLFLSFLVILYFLKVLGVWKFFGC